MLKITLKAPKPRNPLVAATLRRHAGVHRKAAGALRQLSARALRRELRELAPPRRSP